MGNMSWVNLATSPPSGLGTALANTTTLTDISALPNFGLNAGTLKPSMAGTLKAWGVLSTAGTPTINLGFYYGGVAGVALATTGAITCGSGVTNVPWRLELDFVVTANGTSGAIDPQGEFRLGTSVSAWATYPVPNTALATVTINTEANNILTVGAAWSAASASNTITCRKFLITSLN